MGLTAIARLACVAAALMSTGCASIVSGQLQSLSVDTPGCPGARCELSNDKGKWFVSSTPGSVMVGRSYNNLQVVCIKGAASAAPVSVASATKGMAFGNILIGGVIGAGVDIHTGAAYDYPQTVSVPLQCDEALAAAPAARAPRLGIQVVRAPDGGPAGLRIVGLDPGSAAEQAGLKPGDVLRRANDAELPEPETLAALLAALREPWTLELLVSRDGVESTVRIAGPARSRAQTSEDRRTP